MDIFNKNMNARHVNEWRIDVFNGLDHKYCQFVNSPECLEEKMKKLRCTGFRFWIFRVNSDGSLSRLAPSQLPVVQH